MFNPLSGSELHKLMGKWQIHMFFGGFAKREITTLKQLKALGLDEIVKICGEMKMPRAAIDRLLEESGIRAKKKPENTKTPAPSNPVPPSVTKADPAPAPASEEKPDPTSSKESKESKSKREASSYYHFASTPAEEAAKFKPKKVENPTSVKWQQAEGASKWNPGNTFEERNYTKMANERFEEMMKGFKWPGSALRVASMSDCNMDFSIICVRGKVKYIYDMSFSLEVKGKVGDDSVKGTVEMSDIMPDDDPDEWDWSVNMKKNNAAHKSAEKTIEQNKELIIGNVKLLIAQLQAKYSG